MTRPSASMVRNISRVCWCLPTAGTDLGAYGVGWLRGSRLRLLRRVWITPRVRLCGRAQWRGPRRSSRRWSTSEARERLDLRLLVDVVQLRLLELPLQRLDVLFQLRNLGLCGTHIQIYSLSLAALICVIPCCGSVQLSLILHHHMRT